MSGRERTGFIDGAGRLIIGFDRLPEETKIVGEFSEGRAAFFVRKRDAAEPGPSEDYIGVDLHKTNFVACFIEADDTHRLETCPLTRDGLARFTRRLDEADELAVEATQNIRYFYEQVRAHVSRAAVVDTYRCGVVARSKKKTDKADARVRFPKLGWPPAVPVPSEQVRTLRQLQTRGLRVGREPGAAEEARRPSGRGPARATRRAPADRTTRLRGQGARRADQSAASRCAAWGDSDGCMN